MLLSISNRIDTSQLEYLLIKLRYSTLIENLVIVVNIDIVNLQAK